MSMRGFWLGLAVGAISTCLVGQWVFSAAGKESDPPKCISLKTVADYIHSVVQADRTFYTTDIVDRLQTRGIYLRLGTLEKRRRSPFTRPICTRNGAARGETTKWHSISADQQLAHK
jgi:hypothetical protein